MAIGCRRFMYRTLKAIYLGRITDRNSSKTSGACRPIRGPSSSGPRFPAVVRARPLSRRWRSALDEHHLRVADARLDKARARPARDATTQLSRSDAGHGIEIKSRLVESKPTVLTVGCQTSL